MSTETSGNKTMGVLTTPCPPGDLATLHQERLKKHIHEELLKIGDRFVGRVNNKHTQTALKHQMTDYLLKFAREGLAPVDENGRAITADRIEIKGNTIVMPQCIDVVPTWMARR